MRALLCLVFFLCAFAVCFSVAQRQRPSTLSLDREDYPQLFQEWRAIYDKSYDTPAEEQRRFANFVLSIDRARARNLESNTQAHGLNPFSDLSPEEFADRYLMKTNVLDFLRIHEQEFENHTSSIEDAIRMTNPRAERIKSFASDEQAPGWSANTLYDWKFNGYTSPIKDQKQCGSCWAFSATEQIESNYATMHGHLPANLSEQQSVDCDTQSYGCGGGWPPTVYNYVHSAGGLESETAYPYTATNGVCHATATKIVQVNGYRVVGQNNETAMYNFLISGGPLSICLDATSMESYAGNNAILLPSSCSPNNINHCVQLTGFLTDSYGNIKAWNVRNSWGTWWGNNGYAFLQYGRNTCGLTCIPTTASVA